MLQKAIYWFGAIAWVILAIISFINPDSIPLWGVRAAFIILSLNELLNIITYNRLFEND